ncbi:MAG: carbamoyltransferase HypF [Candidatus Zixiibacteriota bacterium]
MRGTSKCAAEICRRQLLVTGAVQGVGFRPFAYRLARELQLCGFVTNNSQGVAIEIQGRQEDVTEFQNRLVAELPPRASISKLFVTKINLRGENKFVIEHSHDEGAKTAIVLPDIATCPDCLNEVFDPSNRRYLYPFTNCTNCGPRYSIIESLPYDRANTTMKRFEMCAACRQEYVDPENRRFHAQPNACPNCGPHVELWSRTGELLASNQEAIFAAAKELKGGAIVAIKGLGGFQLLVDAENDDAVCRLRIRKRRSNKPFALMYPSIEAIARDCELPKSERNIITGAESPIVIVNRRLGNRSLSESVAPGNPRLGVMLPYTPLHHILMKQLDCAIVATSGNLSEEPLCIDEREALNRLREIADIFLVHNRPIKRHVDDSVARVIDGRMQLVRRARGFAPLPIVVSNELPDSVAVGGHLKNTVAFSRGRHILVSQHIGDLETVESNNAFKSTITDLAQLYELKPTLIAGDLHPDYFSSIYSAKLVGAQIGVQHHYAHILSCMADNQIEAPLLGISWDGTGLGIDRTVWGGEFLSVNELSFERVAFLRPFQLPGAEASIKEPRRSAAGILFQLYANSKDEWLKALPSGVFSGNEAETIWQMLKQKLNSPITSSAGRLFDAVAAIVGFADKRSYEGEAASMLEFAIENAVTSESYAFALHQNDGSYEVDWRPMIAQILKDRQEEVSISLISAKFHNTLVEMIVSMAERVRLRKVALSGGCFMNKYLTEQAIKRLRETGFVPYWHHQIPTNDGGISTGQIIAAARARGK